MNPKKKLKALEEIQKAEEEASKYSLRPGQLCHFASRNRRDPDSFWMDLNDKEVKVSRKELDKYSKYSQVIVWVDY